MKHNYLYDALPFLKDVEKERQEQFKEYFKNKPQKCDKRNKKNNALKGQGARLRRGVQGAVGRRA